MGCLLPTAAQCGRVVQTVVDQLFFWGNGLPTYANSTRLSIACNTSCTNALSDSFITTMLQWSSAAGRSKCGVPADFSMLPLLAYSSGIFTCWPLGDAANAGQCAMRVMGALKQANIWDPVRFMTPGFSFSGATLDATCAALRPQGCCLRTFALLMAAWAQQFCMPQLAQEYLSLPGRCSLDQPVSAPCAPLWEARLAGLLKPRADCGVWSGPYGGSAIFNGSACSQAQLTAAETGKCPSDFCDMWCGIIGGLSKASGKVVAATPAAGSGDGGSSSGLSTGVIVFISVFSALVFLLLVAAVAAYVVMYRRERARRRRSSRGRLNHNGGVMGDDALHSGSYKSGGGIGSGVRAGDEGSMPSSLPRTLTAVSAATTGMPRTSGSLLQLTTGGTWSQTQQQRLLELAAMPSPASLAGRSSMGSLTGRGSLGGGSVAGRDSFAGRDSLAGSRASFGAAGGAAGVAGGAGPTSVAGRSSLTVRSLRQEELDVVAPLPSSRATGGGGGSSSALGEQVHYSNALYGGGIPSSDPSPSTSGANTPGAYAGPSATGTGSAAAGTASTAAATGAASAATGGATAGGVAAMAAVAGAVLGASSRGAANVARLSAQPAAGGRGASGSKAGAAAAAAAASPSPPVTPPTRTSKSFSFGVDSTPVESVRSATEGGEWRTAVGMAAATGSARRAAAASGQLPAHTQHQLLVSRSSAGSGVVPIPAAGGSATAAAATMITPPPPAYTRSASAHSGGGSSGGGGTSVPQSPPVSMQGVAVAAMPTGRWRAGSLGRNNVAISSIVPVAAAGAAATGAAMAGAAAGTMSRLRSHSLRASSARQREAAMSAAAGDEGVAPPSSSSEEEASEASSEASYATASGGKHARRPSDGAASSATGSAVRGARVAGAGAGEGAESTASEWASPRGGGGGGSTSGGFHTPGGSTNASFSSARGPGSRLRQG